MSITRRTLLRQLGAGAAAAAAGAPMVDTVAAAPGGSGQSESGGSLRLNRNENAYGPSAAVLAAIRLAAEHQVHRHPDEPSDALVAALSAAHGVQGDRILVGCGSTEIFRMAANAFLGSGRNIVQAQPTFDAIARCARHAGAEVVAVPLTRDYAHDLDAMLARVNSATGLVYICNPNNPTGTLTRRQDLEAFIRTLPATSYVVIDEAYHHYVGHSAFYASFIDRPIDDPRVIVTRSFSKIHGLAGLRVGYAVGDPKTMSILESYRLDEGVNTLAAAAAAVAVADSDHHQLSFQRTADDRQEFLNQVNARMLRAIDSQANFVMVNTGRPAADIVEHFRANRVLVPGPFPLFDTYIRVSLGTPAEMREFWRVWDLMPIHHQMSM